MDNREEFEQWFLSDFGAGLERIGEGYRHATASNSWEAWQRSKDKDSLKVKELFEIIKNLTQQIQILELEKE